MLEAFIVRGTVAEVYLRLSYVLKFVILVWSGGMVTQGRITITKVSFDETSASV